MLKKKRYRKRKRRKGRGGRRPKSIIEFLAGKETRKANVKRYLRKQTSPFNILNVISNDLGKIGFF